MPRSVRNDQADLVAAGDLRRVTVFCGARPGVQPDHLQLAADFGAALVRRGLGLVYGAGGVGMMGSLADAVLADGGDVTGVIPAELHEREQADDARGEIIVVDSMHERKFLMYQLASGFAVLPGGLGTLDELMEVTTWNQLALIRKPIVVLNRGGFFTPLLQMLDHLVAEGYVSEPERRLVQASDDPDETLDLLGLTAAPAGSVPAYPGIVTV